MQLAVIAGLLWTFSLGRIVFFVLQVVIDPITLRSFDSTTCEDTSSTWYDF